MFQHFTKDARRVVVYAQHEANLMFHSRIDTEHLLLSLLQSEAGLSRKCLEELNVTYEEVRSYFAQHIPIGDNTAASHPSHLPFTTTARRIFEQAGVEAKELGQDYVNSGHLLVALASREGSVALDILKDFSVSIEELRRITVSELLSSHVKLEAVTTEPVRLSYDEQLRIQLRELLDDERVSRVHLASALNTVVDSFDESQLNRLIGLLK